MTCIIGLVENDRIYMGCDSMASDGWGRRITSLRKVFCVKNFLIGYTTSFRMGQLLQHRLTIALQNGEDDMAYMVGTFVEAVRQLLKDNGFAKVSENVEEGGYFLVGYKGRLYHIASDFQVNEFTDGFDAVGSGEAYALAVMRVLTDMPPRQRILKALETAAYFSSGVVGPFHVETL